MHFDCYINDSLLKHKSNGLLSDGDTWPPYPSLICQDNVLRTTIDLIKENDFTLKMTESRKNPGETMRDVDYTDDLALLSNKPVQAKSLLHNQEETARGTCSPLKSLWKQIKQESYALIKMDPYPDFLV